MVFFMYGNLLISFLFLLVRSKFEVANVEFGVNSKSFYIPFSNKEKDFLDDKEPIRKIDNGIIKMKC